MKRCMWLCVCACVSCLQQFMSTSLCNGLINVICLTYSHNAYPLLSPQFFSPLSYPLFSRCSSPFYFYLVSFLPLSPVFLSYLIFSHPDMYSMHQWIYSHSVCTGFCGLYRPNANIAVKTWRKKLWNLVNECLSNFKWAVQENYLQELNVRRHEVL